MQGICTIDGLDFDKYNPELDWSGKLFEQYEEIAPLRKQPGIYAFTLCREVVYIGSSINLFGRLQTHIAHMQGNANCTHSSLTWRKYFYLKKYISQVQFQVLEFCNTNISKSELEDIEYSYVNKHNPIFNINRGKSLHQWDGSEQDIDDFVNGNLSMDNLKELTVLCKHPTRGVRHLVPANTDDEI